MKYMNKAQCEAKEAILNVLKEIEILASLEHPFLVNLWFSFQDEEDMFMVVDLLRGGDLRYHLQEGIPFTDDAVRLFILEVASALDYLRQKHIVHRDIKPDNLLLDNEGHVHLTDFNIAAVLEDQYLATSMSGTKPYMAPEVFDCALDRCDGYSYPVDWWSLGITAYEVRRGKRPFDIHSNTPLTDVRLMLLSPPRFPTEWSFGLIQIITKLLTVMPFSRVTSMESLQKIPYAAEISAEQVLKKEVKPPFTPPKEHLNCDPTFELEEMIIESKPLHKKKKRLSKQKSSRNNNSSPILNHTGESPFYDRMLIFNREREEIRKAREKKEREWQEELERSMSLSDPTGQGSNFSGSKSSTKKKKSLKESGSKDDALDGVLSTLIAASACSLTATIGPLEGLQNLEKGGLHSSATESKPSGARNSVRKPTTDSSRISAPGKEIKIKEERIPDNNVNDTSMATKQTSQASTNVTCTQHQVQTNVKMERIEEIEESSKQEKQQRVDSSEPEVVEIGVHGKDENRLCDTLDSKEKSFRKDNSNTVVEVEREPSALKLNGVPLRSQASGENSYKTFRHCQSDHFEGSSSQEKKLRFKMEEKGKFNQSMSFDSYMKNDKGAISTVGPNTRTPPATRSQVPFQPTLPVSYANARPSSVPSSTIVLTPVSSPQDSVFPTPCVTTAVTSDSPTLSKSREEPRVPKQDPSVLQLRRISRPKPQRSISLNLQTSLPPEEHLPNRSSVGGRLEGGVTRPFGSEANCASRVSESTPKQDDEDLLQLNSSQDTEVFIASCSLNPLYTSSLEYICGPSSFHRKHSPAAAKKLYAELNDGTQKRSHHKEDRIPPGPLQLHMAQKGYFPLGKTETTKLPLDGDLSKNGEVLRKKTVSPVEKKVGVVSGCRPNSHNPQAHRPPAYKLHKMYSSASLCQFERSSSNPKIYTRSASSESAKMKSIQSPIEGQI